MNETPMSSPVDPSSEGTRAFLPSPANDPDVTHANILPHSPELVEHPTSPLTTNSDGVPRTVVVPGYEVLEELGRGGMGVVYKARQVGLKRIVALKMILGGVHAGAEVLARFRTEAEAVARLQHPHVVQIHEIGEQDGLPFFSLEYCAGGSLDQRIRKDRLTPHEAAVLVEKLAQGVQAAHDRGILHRDLKPANVLFTEDATPKIADFGLARKLEEQGQTATGAVLGTPSYMAPEQAAGNKQGMGPATDVYALGVILYELLTGRPPFQAAMPLDTLMKVLNEDPVPVRRLQPKVARDLETICLKCLEKTPARRYASASALADDLHRFVSGEPVLARPQPWWRRRRPRRIAGILAALVVAGLLATVAVKWVMDRQQSSALSVEEAEAKEVAARNRLAEARQAAEEHVRDRLPRAKDERDASRVQLKLARQRHDFTLAAFKTGGPSRLQVQESRYLVYQAEDAEMLAAEQMEDLEQAAPLVALRQAEADLATALLQLAEARRAAGESAYDVPALRRAAGETALTAALARLDHARSQVAQSAERTRRLEGVVDRLRQREEQCATAQKETERAVATGGRARAELATAEVKVAEAGRLLRRQVALLEAQKRVDTAAGLQRAEAEVAAARLEALPGNSSEGNKGTQ